MEAPVLSEVEHHENSTAEPWMEEVLRQLSHDVESFLDELVTQEDSRLHQLMADISSLRGRVREATQRYNMNTEIETSANNDAPAEITHRLHPPAHTPTGDAGQGPPRCGGCKEPAAGHTRELTGPYMCCATAPRDIEHPLFPGRVFRLHERPPPPPPWSAADDSRRRACDACGDLLNGDGLAYHCAGAGRGGVDLDLHTRCARLPAARPGAVVVEGYTVELLRVASGRCGICMSGEGGYRGRFWSYRFRRDGDGDGVDLHLSCLKELASQSHETLTVLYEILMNASGSLWMPTNDPGTSSGNSGSERNNGKLPAGDEGGSEEYMFQEKGVNASATLPETIADPSHRQHKLQLVTITGGWPFECDACKEPGDGPRYRCHACNVDVHKFCVEAPATLQHDLLDGRTFWLLAVPPPGPPEPPHPAVARPGGRRCDTCGDPVLGLVYHCSGANLDLHPCCAGLHMWRGGAATWPAVTLDGLPFKIVAPRRCSLCDDEEVGGRRHCQQWCYYYDAGGEGVYLHVGCVKRIARRRWQAGMASGCGGQIMLASEELMNVGGALNSIASSSSEARKVIGAAVRLIIAVIFGDQTAVEGDVSSSVALNLQWLTGLFGIQT